jgi:hypothetical protein
MTDRSARIETRNPLLGLPSYQRLLALPEDAQAVLRDVLGDLRVDAAERAETAWRQRKGPMAAYWRAVSVYALHLRRDLCRKAPKGVTP